MANDASQFDPADLDDEDDGYRFDAADLDDVSEETRGWAIMEVSRLRLSEFEDKLIGMLSDEKCVRNRRHLVRALGNLGSVRSVPLIRSLLTHVEGLIQGDVAEALGKLKVRDAKPDLERLSRSSLDWVANKARWALKQL